MRGKNIEITIHQRNVQFLMTELLKNMNNLSPPPRLNNFKRRNFQEFATERKKAVKCGPETVSYRCPQLWSLEII